MSHYDSSGNYVLTRIDHVAVGQVQQVVVAADRLDVTARGVEQAVQDGGLRRGAAGAEQSAGNEGAGADRSHHSKRHLGFRQTTTPAKGVGP